MKFINFIIEPLTQASQKSPAERPSPSMFVFDQIRRKVIWQNPVKVTLNITVKKLLLWVFIKVVKVCKQHIFHRFYLLASNCLLGHQIRHIENCSFQGQFMPTNRGTAGSPEELWWRSFLCILCWTMKSSKENASCVYPPLSSNFQGLLKRIWRRTLRLCTD